MQRFFARYADFAVKASRSEFWRAFAFVAAAGTLTHSVSEFWAGAVGLLVIIPIVVGLTLMALVALSPQKTHETKE